MQKLFLALCNHAYAASILIIVIFLLRLILRRIHRIPQWCFPLFWTIAAVRLLLPISIPVPFSLIPSARLFDPAVVQYAQRPTVDTGISAVNNTVNPLLGTVLAGEPTNSVQPMYVLSEIAAWIWLFGTVVMLVYLVVSAIRMHRRLREAVPYRDNVWLCDHIGTPFLFGVVHPRIYLPSAMGMEGGSQHMDAVIAHENAHMRRRDHITKLVGFLILAVYWFVPTVWLAYYCFCRDLEYACDAHVIAGLDREGRKRYSEALLSCASRERLSVCPVAFGEKGVKGRIRAILSYRKPPFWCILAVIVAAIVLAVCFLTSPRETVEPPVDETTDGTQVGPTLRFLFDENGIYQSMYPTTSGVTLVVQQSEDPAPDAEEPFYEDADGVYSFPQTIRDRITVSLPDGSSIGVTEALYAGYITLDDLTRAGIAYNVVKKTPEQKLVDTLVSSIRCAYGQITFTLPESQGEWSLHIAGAYVLPDGEMTLSGVEPGNTAGVNFSMSRHFLEDTIWEPGKSYAFDYGKVDGKTAWYRSLEMDIVYNGYECTVSLTALFPEELTGGAENAMPEMHIVPIR